MTTKVANASPSTSYEVKIFPFQKMEKMLPSQPSKFSSHVLYEQQEIIFPQIPTFTKSIMFELSMPTKMRASINSAILASSGLSMLKGVMEKKLVINFTIPVNMRPFLNVPVSPFQLGFYSSWVSFDYKICKSADKFKTANDMSQLLTNAINNHDHILNFYRLGANQRSKKIDGIIKNLLSSKKQSICISNIGKVKIRTKYLNDTLIIRSMHLGLNSFYRSKNFFLLIANGLDDKIFFTFHYKQPCMTSDQAESIVNHFKETILEFFETN